MLKKLLILALLLVAGLFLLVQTSRDSRFESESSQLLNQPVGQVWQLLADVDGWRQWWPGVKQVKLLGPLAVGSLIDLHFKGVPEEHPVKLIRFETGHQLAWQRQGVLGSVAETEVLLRPQGEGTLLTIRTLIVGPQARLAEFFNADSFAQYQELFLKSVEFYLPERLSQSVAGEKD